MRRIECDLDAVRVVPGFDNDAVTLRFYQEPPEILSGGRQEPAHLRLRNNFASTFLERITTTAGPWNTRPLVYTSGGTVVDFVVRSDRSVTELKGLLEQRGTVDFVTFQIPHIFYVLAADNPEQLANLVRGSVAAVQPSPIEIFRS